MSPETPDPLPARALSWVVTGCVAALAIAGTIAFIRYLF